MKTSELTGAALDWAVCEAAGLFAAYPKYRSGKAFAKLHAGNSAKYVHPSTDWAQGGPIIDSMSRRGVRITGSKCRYETDEPTFTASLDGYYKSHGPTPLIAAMRCYVASKLGDEVEVPEEIK